MQTTTQFPPTQATSPGPTIEAGGLSEVAEQWQGLFPGFAERLKEIRAEQEALRPKVRSLVGSLYGVDDDANVRAYWRIERLTRQCVGCTGEPCQKDVFKYQYVTARLINGEIREDYRRCEVGLRRALKKAVKRSGMPARYVDKTFADYEVTPDNERAVKVAKWFIDTQGKKSLYFCGDCGTGKTFLAALIAKAYIKAQRVVVFGDVPTLLEDIKRSFDTGGTEALFSRYSDCDLLVLDDIGTGKITDWTNDVLYRLVNDRYANDRPVIFTSNYDLKNLRRVLSKGDEFTGKRIVSRLAEMSVQASLGTVDRRLAGKS